MSEAPWEQMEAVTFVAEKMGAQCITSEEGLFVQCSKRPQAIPYLRTGPYPGFPTDLQSVAMAVLPKAEAPVEAVEAGAEPQAASDRARAAAVTAATTIR